MTEPTTAEPSVTDPGGSRRVTPLIIVLAAILVALLATSAVLSQRSSAKVDASAIAVGKQEALNFFSLDSANVTADVNAVLSLAANPFKAQYAAKSAAIEAGVNSQHLTVTASVPPSSAGLEYEHGNSAIVIVAVDETIAAPTGQPQTNRYRVRLHLSKISGKWRVTQVQQVG